MSILELDRVSKRFRRGATEVVALDDVSLSLDPGDFVAVWGASNSGKTTLLRVAAGVVRADRGAVRFDGRDLALLSGRERTHLLLEEIGCAWRHVAESPQLPVVDRVAVPLLHRFHPRAARERALDALRLVRAEGCAGARWDEIQDGDRARVRVAQALVRDPRLLLADEPTVNLNLVEREEVLAVLRAAAKERRTAVLLTAPDAPNTLRADQTVSIAEGALIVPPPMPPGPSGTVVDFRGPDQRPGSHGA